MPFSEEYKKKCYCTRVRYRNTPPSAWNYICEEHRNEWDSRFIKIYDVGMRDGVDFKLTYEIGFEKFGAYETWGQGWVSEGTVKGKRITASHRYMEHSVEAWLLAAEEIISAPVGNSNVEDRKA